MYMNCKHFIVHFFYRPTFHYIFTLVSFNLNVQLLILHGIGIIVIITFPIITLGTLTFKCNSGRFDDSIIIGIAIYLKYLQI